jgi:hypothetical protein
MKPGKEGLRVRTAHWPSAFVRTEPQMPLETAGSGIILGVVRNNARGFGFNASTLCTRP